MRGALGIALIAGVVTACNAIFGLEEGQLASSSGCASAAECDDHDDCTDDACAGGECSHTPLADGPLPTQFAGDCSSNVCKVGVETTVVDDADLPKSGDCAIGACKMGVPSLVSKPSGTSCMVGSAAGHCDSGKCSVACGAMTAGCDDKNPCTTEVCDPIALQCVYTDLNGVPTPDLIPPEKVGDCHVHVCVGGKDLDVVDDTDVKKTPTDCDAELCNSGTPSNPPDSLGTSCATSGGTVCDGKANCVQCNQPSDCSALPPDDACHTVTCVANKCGQIFAPLNFVVPGVQTTGDCKVIECDGAGKQVTNADGADLPNDNNVCTTDTCSGKTPVTTSLAQGTSCGAASVCDGAPVNPKCQGCNGPMDCAGYVNDDCKQTTCIVGTCGTNFTVNLTPTANQMSGNCKTNVCDGAGNAHDVVTAGDVPIDGKDCTNDVCTAGTPSNPPKAIDTTCATGYCDGAGTCAQCGSTPVSECPAPPVCVSATCSNHICGTVNVANNTNAPPSSQTPNDCKTIECDGNGGTKAVATPGDLPVANNVCQVPGCSGTMPTFTAAAPGTACNFMGAGKTVCDGVSTAGVCVQCVTNAQCTAPQTCVTYFCSG